MDLEQRLDGLMAAQQEFFLRGETRAHEFRAAQLQKLYRAVQQYEAEILQALKADIGKPDMEGYAGEVGFVYAELRHTLRHLRSWMEPERAGTPMVLQPAACHILTEPLGEVLIIGPWNYPFQLLIAPLVGAIAAGNVAVLKPSELAPHTAAVVEKLIAETFPPAFVAVVQGGVPETQALLHRCWDYIFFTGSTAVGRIVARAAAEHLTPVTLELGGKSPCIVDQELHLDLAARRIVWGKFFNAGQTCVAPDYLLVHAAVRERLLDRMQHYLREFFGADPKASEDYARIVSLRHFDRLSAMLGQGRVIAGGQADRDSLYIAPTILADVPLSASAMQEEIFGPVLPVVEYQHLDEAIAFVRRFPKPLALYLFTSDAGVQRRILAELSFGGGCINTTLMHLSNPHLPFGGVGESGMGAYHGKYSYDTFSHRKAILRSTIPLDPKVLYPPYGQKLKLIRRVMR